MLSGLALQMATPTGVRDLVAQLSTLKAELAAKNARLQMWEGLGLDLAAVQVR